MELSGRAHPGEDALGDRASRHATHRRVGPRGVPTPSGGNDRSGRAGARGSPTRIPVAGAVPHRGGRARLSSCSSRARGAQRDVAPRTTARRPCSRSARACCCSPRRRPSVAAGPRAPGGGRAQALGLGRRRPGGSRSTGLPRHRRRGYHPPGQRHRPGRRAAHRGDRGDRCRAVADRPDGVRGGCAGTSLGEELLFRGCCCGRSCAGPLRPAAATAVLFAAAHADARTSCGRAPSRW